jgi:hypothetical protein
MEMTESVDDEAIKEAEELNKELDRLRSEKREHIDNKKVKQEQNTQQNKNIFK